MRLTAGERPNWRSIAGLASCALFLLTMLAGPANSEARDIVHRGKFWSWTGPANWNAVYGAYGIKVFSPSGTSAIDLGFSSIACTPGGSVAQSVNRYFAAQRRAISRGPTRITRAGAIRRVGGLGPNYFRQTLSLRSRQGRIALRGQAFLDYQVPDTFYCYQRSRSMVVPARGFARRIRALNRVYRSFAYFGPGTPEPPRQ
jgi:hypothetical protein